MHCVRWICFLIMLAATALGGGARGAVVPAEFPFEYRQGLIWVEVGVRESPTPLNFLLDSGAGLSVINLSTLERIGHLGGRRLKVHGVGTTATGYWPQHLAVTEGDLPLAKDLLAVDLSALSRTCNRPVDGLIGADFFLDRAVRIDFVARRIRLSSNQPMEQPQVILPLNVHRGALRVPICFDHGLLQWTRLDTGCASALHWVNAKIRPGETQEHISVGLAALPVPIILTSVQLGGLDFESVRTAVHKKAIFAGEAGLLGNQILSQFSSVTIDVPGHRVVLAGLPNHAQILNTKG